ncbi:hypothetical protein PCASD_25958 [Puccinia coronata f. sp. avenae]|uniref:Uncharacterized protein n=1 Tax=Puccinia coronata f. sp. avenae TaxID=200324 RepID=A0A2N5TYQ5_9BASI|nr:hypothetical protein PCASD_25958 [Puccinia coronata f. sp. avenae]
MLNDKNPKKTNLAFDGSNFSDWEKAINRTLVNAFNRDSLFIRNLDNFNKLNRPKNQAVASLICNLLKPALLTTLESGANNKPRDLFPSVLFVIKGFGDTSKTAVAITNGIKDVAHVFMQC